MPSSDANSVATPEGWTPGCKVIVPPPKTAAEAGASEADDTIDWYDSTKSR